jgi:phosphatidylglycerophosphate synthase
MASASAGNILPRSRPRELEDPLNHFIYHPLAARLARLLVPTGISPNAVSVMSLVSLCAAAWAFVGVDWPLNALIGLAFMMLWHIVDGADGDLARMTGRASATGELVDGVCDYAGNIILYFAFAFRLDDTLGLWGWLLAVAAGASHIVQTNHAETQRRLYLWRAYGVPWLRNAAASGDPLFSRQGWFNRLFGFWAVAYVWLSDRMSPSANPIDSALAGAAGDPREIQRIRAMVRRASRTSLVLQKGLGANPKTIIIAAAIALGSPLYYFLTMILALNLLLAISILHHKRVDRRLAAALSRSPSDHAERRGSSRRADPMSARAHKPARPS